jgi:hypothetical protein
VGGSGCREAALELSLPLTLREGVPTRGGAGLETVAPGRIAGDCVPISFHIKTTNEEYLQQVYQECCHSLRRL